MPFLSENCLPSHTLVIVDQFVKQLRPSQLERLETLSLNHPVILNGQCFFRSTSVNGTDFTFPVHEMAEKDVIAWSYIAERNEILCALNLDESSYAIVYVTVDNEIHDIGSTMECLYASELCPAERSVETRNGKAIRLFIPPHALVIYH